MTRQEVLFEQRLRLALTIVYLCLATANIVLMLKEKKAAEQKPAAETVPEIEQRADEAENP